MKQLTQEQVESLGYEVTGFTHAFLIASCSSTATLAHRGCPICGCEGGLTLGTLRIHLGDQTIDLTHRCHIECIDWPTVPVGNRWDPERARCICDECLEALGRSTDLCPLVPEPDQRACWMCEDMMRAAQREAQAKAFEATLAREAQLIDALGDRT